MMKNVWHFSLLCCLFVNLLFPGVSVAAYSTDTLLPGTSYATKVCINASPISGPAALILGGVHGNEPAGSLAAEQLCVLDIQRGTLIVIPSVNATALAQHVRTLAETGDINRAYPGLGNTPAHQIAAAIVDIANRHSISLLIDMHEARTFHRKDRSSLGQSILFANNTRSTDLAMDLVDEINATLSDSWLKFSLIAHPIGNSAAEYFGRQPNVASFTMETSSTQPIADRISQHLFLAKSLLRREGILP